LVNIVSRWKLYSYQLFFFSYFRFFWLWASDVKWDLRISKSFHFNFIFFAFQRVLPYDCFLSYCYGSIFDLFYIDIDVRHSLVCCCRLFRNWCCYNCYILAYAYHFVIRRKKLCLSRTHHFFAPETDALYSVGETFTVHVSVLSFCIYIEYDMSFVSLICQPKGEDHWSTPNLTIEKQK
jgi:hypothetical protein